MTQFDVALSFAGEDRSIARRLAQLLKERGLIIFYDDDQQGDLLGENLTEYLIDIYKNRSSFCVILVSEHYVRKRWTRHEWRAAQARALQEFDRSYLLPVRLDDSDLPGLLPTTGYLSAKTKSLEEIADVVSTKVSHFAELNKLLRIAQAAYRRGDFIRVIELLGSETQSAALQRNHEAYRLLADSTLILGDLNRAFPLYEDIVRHHPEDAEAWFQLGVCSARLGLFTKAQEAYVRTLQIAPFHTTAEADLRYVRRWIRLQRIPGIGRLLIGLRFRRFGQANRA